MPGSPKTMMIVRLASTIFPGILDLGAPSWRQRSFVTGIAGAVLMVSLALGYQVAARRTLSREALLARDIGLPLGSIVAAVENDRQQLMRFAGRPCAAIAAGLTEDMRSAPYVRNAYFVKDNRLYCSVVSGTSNFPLSAYIPSSSAAQLIAMRPGTPRYPLRPAMVVFDRLSQRTGIGFIIPGAYLKDILLSAQASGAQSALVVGSDGSAIASDGRYMAAALPGKNWGSYIAPDALFSVSVDGGLAWRIQDLVEVEGAALLLGLLSASAIAAGYLAGYTPRQRLIRRVRRGLARGEFFVVYQPIVDLATGQWVGAEALVRWQHPRLGLVMPGQFIGEVERSPVIADLTQYVFRQALTELGNLHLPNGFRLTVNLAAFHAGLRCFPQDLSDIILASHTSLQIVLEITERGLLDSIENVKGSMNRLRRYGVKFAVDDFGTENSNLALLQRFDFDYIKIDRQFVQGVVSDDRALVQGITFLAGQVGARVVAEGVEEPAQEAALKTIGVPLAQGFLFAKPRRAAEFARAYAASVERAAAISA